MTSVNNIVTFCTDLHDESDLAIAGAHGMHGVLSFDGNCGLRDHEE